MVELERPEQVQVQEEQEGAMLVGRWSPDGRRRCRQGSTYQSGRYQQEKGSEISSDLT